MAADLAQLEQGVQNGHLALSHTLFLDLLQDLLLKALGQRGIQLLLLVDQGREVYRLHFGRQVFGHVVFGPAQDKGSDPGSQVFHALRIPVLDRFDKTFLKGVLGAQETGH